tara:strand:+ start:5634 stop:6134 length:501 start_codon:yes stop_codon:yes gene_type:complete
MTTLVFAIPLLLFSAELEWDIEYESWSDGPRTVYAGTATLYMTEENNSPCMEYTFEIPKDGRLAGPAISSDPGEPMLRFDWVYQQDETIDVEWCRTSSDRQILPVAVPRHFLFFVMQTQFGPDDLLKLLSEWGAEESPWDLNNDRLVNGEDLTILLGGWKNNEGTP